MVYASWGRSVAYLTVDLGMQKIRKLDYSCKKYRYLRSLKMLKCVENGQEPFHVTIGILLNSGVCQLHLISKDFQEDRVDSNERRKRKKGTLKLAKLKEDAVPHIFPNLPSYLSKETPLKEWSSYC